MQGTACLLELLVAGGTDAAVVTDTAVACEEGRADPAEGAAWVPNRPSRG